jgi:hypothetical protein
MRSIIGNTKLSERFSSFRGERSSSSGTRSTANTIVQLPSNNGNVLQLLCLIEGESLVFNARVPHASATVGDLGKAVRKERDLGVLKDVDPVTLELWKVVLLSHYHVKRCGLLLPMTGRH